MNEDHDPTWQADQARAAAADAVHRVREGVASGGFVHSGQEMPAGVFNGLKRLLFAQAGLELCDESHFRGGVQPMHWIPSMPGIMRCDNCAQAAVDSYVRDRADRCDLCGRQDLRNPAAAPPPNLIHVPVGQFIIHAVICPGCYGDD
jgi:hypothetical protein